MATRRQLLGGLAAASAWARGAVAAEPAVTLLAAAKIKGANTGARWRDGLADAVALPGRGHAVIRAPGGKALFVARRPGVFAAVVDPRDPAAPPQVMAPAKGCVFSGHAAISPDGRLLVTSEFATEGLQARAVPRDLATGRPTGAWALPGVEPHDMVFAHGGATLVVAIGGLVKDGGVAGPAFNPGGVDSSLAEVDPASGRVLKRHKLGTEHASLSLRHLALSPDGRRVAFAMQDQDLGERRPLVGVLEVGGDLTLLPLPDPEACDFRGYAGSIAYDRTGRLIAATSPRGSVVGLWSGSDGRWLGGLRISDVCGLAQGRGPGEFWASSGLGEVVRLKASDSGLIAVRRWSGEAGFDNHLLMV